MNYDGKTYRNLEGQVKYLTEVAEALDNRITEVAANIPSKMIVEELPEEGDPNITYYVGPKGTEPNLYYEVWVWVQEVEDGPFVWRELEDTDQVDLSGYLPIQTGTTTEKQVYTKNADGTQTMIDTAQSVVGGAIPIRSSAGHILVPDTPNNDSYATSKKYVDNNFLAKQTVVTERQQLYSKNPDGTQAMVNLAIGNVVGSIPIRDGSGRFSVEVPDTDYNVANKKYVVDNFLAKRTTSTSTAQLYAKNAAGNEQQMIVVTDGVWANGVPIRTSAGQINIPLVPVNDNHAASKKYVDDAVGQLIYTHAITLSFTVNSRSFILNITLLNNDSTAYTSASGEDLLEYIQDGVYSITTNSYRNASYWSVAVCPSDKYSHSNTGIGFYLTAGVDGSTIYVDGIDPSYNTDISGVTVTDSVTTW